MSDAVDTSVETSVVVDVPVERAFELFTGDMAGWWPPEHHILQSELQEMVFEPRVGGGVFDRGTDGTVCRWARVLAYEPPTRLVISWDINLQWQIETDPAKTSEVEVRFEAAGPDRTRVRLEHRHLDRHGDGWENMRDAVGSSGGWTVGLDRFAAFVVRAPVTKR
jgi:uncharacterized protein YndB with AHSA1/START domain